MCYLCCKCGCKNNCRGKVHSNWLMLPCSLPTDNLLALCTSLQDFEACCCYSNRAFWPLPIVLGWNGNCNYTSLFYERILICVFNTYVAEWPTVHKPSSCGLHWTCSYIILRYQMWSLSSVLWMNTYQDCDGYSRLSIKLNHCTQTPTGYSRCICLT